MTLLLDNVRLLGSWELRSSTLAWKEELDEGEGEVGIRWSQCTNSRDRREPKRQVQRQDCNSDPTDFVEKGKWKARLGLAAFCRAFHLCSQIPCSCAVLRLCLCCACIRRMDKVGRKPPNVPASFLNPVYQVVPSCLLYLAFMTAGLERNQDCTAIMLLVYSSHSSSCISPASRLSTCIL